MNCAPFLAPTPGVCHRLARGNTTAAEVESSEKGETGHGRARAGARRIAGSLKLQIFGTMST